ncbi:MAG TPA: tyrosine--tRNA ligase, partial [Acidobacteriaceae bacterium]|nr:tyrosine--tRNA ligase [Acidobacteriaceae bacterium]
DGPTDAAMVNNLDWTKDLSAIDFLRDVGKHFTVNQMLGKESVSARLEGGISFTEFSYMLLQAHDFLALNQRHGCLLQVGGSDQWGNITAGLDLLRKVGGVSGHALTAPLIMNASGKKFGKSETGESVWLDPAMTSPYAFYQWWLNTDDRDVAKHLRTFTFRSREETEALVQAAAERPQTREAQRALAEDMTRLVHGPEQLARAQAASQALFGRSALEELDEATLAAALAETPLVAVGPGPLPPVVELLADAGLVESRSAARRVVQEGGAYLNNRKVEDITAVPGEGDLLHGRFLVLRRGRQKVAGVERRA